MIKLIKCMLLFLPETAAYSMLSLLPYIAGYLSKMLCFNGNWKFSGLSPEPVILPHPEPDESSSSLHNMRTYI